MGNSKAQGSTPTTQELRTQLIKLDHQRGAKLQIANGIWESKKVSEDAIVVKDILDIEEWYINQLMQLFQTYADTQAAAARDAALVDYLKWRTKQNKPTKFLKEYMEYVQKLAPSQEKENA